MAWIGLFLFFFLLLGLDFLVFAKKAPSTNRTLKETSFLVSVALAFSGVIYWLYANGSIANLSDLSPSSATIKYLTGYLIELSLSMDNLFVMAVIFKAYKVPLKHQHRVLFWGIVGAIVFRLLMISAGVALISRISWMSYVFGAFLLFTAIRMMLHKENDQPSAERKPHFLEHWLRFSKEMREGDFSFIENGRRYFTPLFLALIVVEFTDVLFALDSIPAILAITTDPFLVFSSNIFAILGLRSMYFLLADMLERFTYLKQSVFAILLFVGLKMILHDFVHPPEWVSLAVIGLLLGGGVALSYFKSSASSNVDRSDE